MPEQDSTPPPQQSPGTEQKKELPKALWLSRGALLANIIALARLMQTVSFGWFLALAYALFFIIGIEVLGEPALKRFRWVLSFGVLAGMACFVVFVQFAKAPVNLEAYVRPGSHPANTSIGGIPWDPHFTDLRIALTNPTDDDYKDLDVVIVPDGWTYEATLLSTGADCKLFRMEGNIFNVAQSGSGGKATFTARRVGSGFETYDDRGNIYKTLASDNGYRLICAKVPRRYTVQIVFAAVEVLPDLMKNRFPVAPGHIGLLVEEMNTTNMFDLLAPRPTVNSAFFNGTYTRGLKPYLLQRTITVGN